MNGINVVILGGNVVRDLKPLSTCTSSPIVEFILAVNRKFRSRENTLKETVAFVSVIAFGTLADFCTHTLRKGSTCVVEGRIENFKSPQGKERKTKVVAENIQVPGRRP